MSEAREIDKQLLRAAENGNLAGVQAALQGGANVEAKAMFDDTALNQAAEWGHMDVVQALLDAGANIHNKGGADKTPIKNAAFAGHVEIVRLLLSKGAQIDNDLLMSLQMKVGILEENCGNGIVTEEQVAQWKSFFAEMVAKANEQHAKA